MSIILRDERVALTLLVDAFIILALREFIVNVVKVNKEVLNSFDSIFTSDVNYNLLILSVVIIFLLIVRYLSIKTSQKFLLEQKYNDFIKK